MRPGPICSTDMFVSASWPPWMPIMHSCRRAAAAWLVHHSGSSTVQSAGHPEQEPCHRHSAPCQESVQAELHDAHLFLVYSLLFTACSVWQWLQRSSAGSFGTVGCGLGPGTACWWCVAQAVLTAGHTACHVSRHALPAHAAAKHSRKLIHIR